MDMDIDMDIDLDVGHMDAEAMIEAPNNGLSYTPNISLPDDPLTRQQDDAQIVSEKIHVRGVDNLSSADVKAFAGEHYPLQDFERIEWIDDCSANLIYTLADAAAEALQALTDGAVINMDPAAVPLYQLRPAKRFSFKPEVELFIRQATTIDVKQKGAHEASRYYLLNPDQDPRERKRDSNRRPRGNRDGDDVDYNRRRFDDREHKRRREDAAVGFDASMYDDDVDTRGHNNVRDDRRKRARLRSGDDLFANSHGSGRLRGRSASPLGDGDGTMGFGTDADANTTQRRARARSRSPGNSFQRNNGRELFPNALSSQQSRKELFPSKSPGQERSQLDLFPDKGLTSPGMRSSTELFPNKRSSHRRSGAFDASGADAAAFLASNNSHNTPPPPRNRPLAERITGGPSYAAHDEIHVRGAGGISVRGASQAQNTSARELFPLRAGAGNGNQGKELFGEKIHGRGGPRRKAEDLFS